MARTTSVRKTQSARVAPNDHDCRDTRSEQSDGQNRGGDKGDLPAVHAGLLHVFVVDSTKWPVARRARRVQAIVAPDRGTARRLLRSTRPKSSVTLDRAFVSLRTREQSGMGPIRLTSQGCIDRQDDEAVI